MAWSKVFEIEVDGRTVVGEGEVGTEGGYKLSTTAKSDQLPPVPVNDEGPTFGLPMVKGSTYADNTETVAGLGDFLEEMEFSPEDIQTNLSKFDGV